jgi:acetyl-CoA carboxylase, biotin carboxylase subunit
MDKIIMLFTPRDLVRVQAAGVPTVPGSDGLIKDEADALRQIQNIGFPVMIKATAGGGGRGMRLCKEAADFIPLLNQASQEALGAFGNGAVYLERYVQDPRHIEFQVRPHFILWTS